MLQSHPFNIPQKMSFESFNFLLHIRLEGYKYFIKDMKELTGIKQKNS